MPNNNLHTDYYAEKLRLIEKRVARLNASSFPEDELADIQLFAQCILDEATRQRRSITTRNMANGSAK